MELTTDERGEFTALLDEIIPPSADGRMPGAGELGLAEALGRSLAHLDGFREGLVALDHEARKNFECGFSDLCRQDRRKILDRVAELQPGFVPSLLFPIYVAYYENERVSIALGREGRPPHPGGYELESLDDKLLAPVSQRGRIYREF